MSERLELIFALGSTRPESVAAMLVDALRGTGFESDRYELNDARTPAEAVSRAVRDRGKKWFSLSNARVGADYNSLPRFELDYLHLKAPDSEFGPLAAGFVQKLHSQGEFVMAWRVNAEYDYWQNVDDPLMYEIQKRDHSRLPKISDGLPPPVGKMIIDTSNNPGLRVLRKGYVEAVANEMWLDERFFALTGADKQALKETHGLRLSQPAGAPYVALSAGDGLFKSDEGEARRLQEQLRALLYPRMASRRQDRQHADVRH